MYQDERNQLKGHGKEEECAQHAAPKRTKTVVTQEKTATTTIELDENKKTRTREKALNVFQDVSNKQRKSTHTTIKQGRQEICTKLHQAIRDGEY